MDNFSAALQHLRDAHDKEIEGRNDSYAKGLCNIFAKLLTSFQLPGGSLA